MGRRFEADRRSATARRMRDLFLVPKSTSKDFGVGNFFEHIRRQFAPATGQSWFIGDGTVDDHIWQRVGAPHRTRIGSRSLIACQNLRSSDRQIPRALRRNLSPRVCLHRSVKSAVKSSVTAQSDWEFARSTHPSASRPPNTLRSPSSGFL
jgi:hypothetical protein